MTVVVEEEVAFEGGSRGGEAVDEVEFFAFGVEVGDFEDVFEEGYAGGGCGGHYDCGWSDGCLGREWDMSFVMVVVWRDELMDCR